MQRSITVILATLLVSLVCYRSGRAQTAASQEKSPVEFIDEWGARGDDPGQFDAPVGPAIGDDSRIYFVERATHFVQKFDLRGTPLLSFEAPGVRDASGIAVDSGGAIYVADALAGQVQVFFPEGPPLQVFRIAAQRDLDGPFLLSVDAAGKIYVPDPAEGRVQVFSARGRLERSWRLQGTARGVAAHPVAAVAGLDGFVYVDDAAGGRIEKFAAASGEQIIGWADLGGGTLRGLAVSAKYVFALRSMSPHLQVWTTEGHPVFSDDLGGRFDASSPAKLSFAVGPRGDMIVLNSGVPRIFHFRVHLDFP